MSKKKLLTVAGLMIIAGLVLMVSSGLNGASRRVVIGGNNGASDEKKKGTVEIAEFDELTIDAGDVDVYLEEGDHYGLEYYAREVATPEVVQDGKKLSIKEPKKQPVTVYFFQFDINLKEQSSYYKITVPKDIAPIKVDIKKTDDLVNINGVDIDGKVASSTDDIFISDCTSSNLSVKASTDNVTLNNVKLGTADIQAGDDINISVSGKQADYALDLNTSCHDDIMVNGARYEGEYKAENTSGKSIMAKSSTGEVSITFVGE